MTELPKDPVMLLSFVNTQLRDHYPSLLEFGYAYQCSSEELIEKLRGIGYEYDKDLNKFI